MEGIEQINLIDFLAYPPIVTFMQEQVFLNNSKLR